MPNKTKGYINIWSEKMFIKFGNLILLRKISVLL